MTKFDRIAYVTQKEFDELLEYSTSIPTGVFIGKMWKRREPYTASAAKAHWLLGEYIEGPKPNTANLQWRDLVIGEPTEFLDYQI